MGRDVKNSKSTGTKASSSSKRDTIMRQRKQENKQLLTDYVEHHNLTLPKKEFRALLFAINGMTIYYQTKPEAIAKTSAMFKITKSFIKKHLDAMGIVSERAIQARQYYGRAQGIARSLLQRKMEKEDD